MFSLLNIKNLSNYRVIYHFKTFSKMMHDNQVDKKHFVLANAQRIEELKCVSAFKQLSDKEKLYAHYFNQASRYIGLVALIQSSPEAPLIYSLLHRILKAETVEDLKTAALNAGVNEDDFTAFLVYATGFFSNAGNYKGMGDTKFVPNLNMDQFELIVKSSRAYKQHDIVSDLWTKCKKPIFYLTERTKCIGLGRNGITTYFSENCTKEDSDRVTEWLQMKKIIAYNSRAFKIEANGTVTYEIKLASSELGEKEGVTLPPEVYKGHTFVVSRGDYGLILELVNEYLGEAKKYAANDNQVQMIENYIKHFTEGKIDDHKNGSRYWIKDKGPVVETYTGYIAPYRDPAGIRAEFSSLVSMVNKETSEKFTKMVNNAESFLAALPWSKEFEKDVFLKPDFTALEVLSFDGAVVPAGISIPPYEDIRQNEGFKNVSLENVNFMSLCYFMMV